MASGSYNYAFIGKNTMLDRYKLLGIVVLVLVVLLSLIQKILNNYSVMEDPNPSVFEEVAIEGMENYSYFCSDGGPFVLLPLTIKKKWKGVTLLSNPLAPGSDYGKACQVVTSGYDGCGYGVIDAYNHKVFVLDAPMMAMSKELNKAAFCIYGLVSWKDNNLDGLIDTAKGTLTESDFTKTGKSVEFDVDGLVFMYAGDRYGNCMYSFREISLKAGAYNISEARWKNDGSEVRVLRFNLEE